LCETDILPRFLDLNEELSSWGLLKQKYSSLTQNDRKINKIRVELRHLEVTSLGTEINGRTV
jgi:hypothetical protein